MKDFEQISLVKSQSVGSPINGWGFVNVGVRFRRVRWWPIRTLYLRLLFARDGANGWTMNVPQFLFFPKQRTLDWPNYRPIDVPEQVTIACNLPHHFWNRDDG